MAAPLRDFRTRFIDLTGLLQRICLWIAWNCVAGFVFRVLVVRRVRGPGDLSRLVPSAVSRSEHAYRCFEVYDTASMCENWRETRGGGPARPRPPTLFFRLAFAARASVRGHSVARPCLPGFVTDSIALWRAAVCGETAWGGRQLVLPRRHFFALVCRPFLACFTMVPCVVV